MKFFALITLAGLSLALIEEAKYPADNSYDDEPSPYQFAWAVDDAPSLNQYAHEESSDGKTATGLYRVLLPDGRTQVVNYVAGEDGYTSEVKYVDNETGYANDVYLDKTVKSKGSEYQQTPPYQPDYVPERYATPEKQTSYGRPVPAKPYSESNYKVPNYRPDKIPKKSYESYEASSAYEPARTAPSYSLSAPPSASESKYEGPTSTQSEVYEPPKYSPPIYEPSKKRPNEGKAPKVSQYRTPYATEYGKPAAESYGTYSLKPSKYDLKNPGEAGHSKRVDYRLPVNNKQSQSEPTYGAKISPKNEDYGNSNQKSPHSQEAKVYN